MQLEQLVMTLAPEDQLYLKRYALLRERLAVRDLPVDDILARLRLRRRRANSSSNSRSRTSSSNREAHRGDDSQLLGETLKNLTQADKNQVTAQADEANAIMEVLERGLSGGADGGGEAGAQPKAGKKQPPSAGLLELLDLKLRSVDRSLRSVGKEDLGAAQARARGTEEIKGWFLRRVLSLRKTLTTPTLESK